MAWKLFGTKKELKDKLPDEPVESIYVERYIPYPSLYGFCSTDCSSGVLYSPHISMEYKEEEVDKCEYCGNMSEERNPIGNCLGCGGPRKPPKNRKRRK